MGEKCCMCELIWRWQREKKMWNEFSYFSSFPPILCTQSSSWTREENIWFKGYAKAFFNITELWRMKMEEGKVHGPQEHSNKVGENVREGIKRVRKILQSCWDYWAGETLKTFLSKSRKSQLWLFHFPSEWIFHVEGNCFFFVTTFLVRMWTSMARGDR